MPRAKDDYSKLVDELLDHVVFAVGAGARVHIKREAIRDFIQVIAKPFKDEISRPRDPGNPDDPPPGEPRWDQRRRFLLGGFQTIGKLAATYATARGSIIIEVPDLKTAYNKVRSNYSEQPGPYCPPWEP
jgi:hypothetical protein